MVEVASKEDFNLLEKRNKELLNELNKLRSKPRGRGAYLLIIIGSLLFAFSLDYSQPLVGFLSLALLFWGILFLYIKPTDFVRQDLLASILMETNEYYAQILNSLGYEGTPYYYSPKTLSDFTNVHLIVPKDKNELFGADLNLSGFLKITPLGLELSNLIEEESKINFAVSDLKKVFSHISEILRNDLEIVKKFESHVDGNNIKIKITESTLKNKDRKNALLWDYLSNSIACAIAKSTHKPVLIKDVYDELNGRITVTEYEIIDHEAL